MDETKHPISLTVLWQDQKLTVEDIIPKIVEYSRDRNIPVNPEEAERIARQIHRAYKKYHDPTQYVGSFMVEFAGDSLRRVMSAGDNLNLRVLNLYHYYFYNCAPGDWREKIR